MNDRPEILAPVASWEMLEAAVRCHADAVYLGMGQFHARQGADDFQDTALSEIVSYCHTRGVAVHLTLNTLVREQELDAVLRDIRTACDAGVDALIVQDLGVARLCRAAAPQMPLHASTQLSCHTPEGVKTLRDLGFSRVVLARELSAEEIEACTGLGVEIEVFVHGALCMSVSGQCYLSALLGGRSGNRGRCAGACRLPFAPAERTRVATDAACLSLRDLSILDRIPALWRMGVCSFKIEGRRKRPEYVAAAVTAARRAADGLPADAALLQDLQNVFSRSGFTDSYYTGKRDATLFGVRRKEDVVAAEAAQKRLRTLYRGEVGRVPISLTLTAQSGAPVTVVAADGDGHRAVAQGEPPLASAENSDTARLQAKLGNCGGTPFIAQTVGLDIGDSVYVPSSAVGALRREALQTLSALRGAVTPRPFTPLRPSAPYVPPTTARRRYVRVADAAQASDLPTVDRIFFPLTTDAEILRAWACRTEVGVEIPRALFCGESVVRAALSRAYAAGCRFALCGNIGAIRLASEAGLVPVGQFSLNLENHHALDAVAALGVREAVLSLELTFAQMRFAYPDGMRVGAFTYGRIPVMLTRPCPRRAAVGGCGGCERQGLCDRKGAVFPLACGDGYTELLNSVPLYLADILTELPPLDFELFYFTDETPLEACRILDAYRTNAPAVGAITRGLYRRGVE